MSRRSYDKEKMSKKIQKEKDHARLKYSLIIGS